MIGLTIEDFACIREARFELAPVTVLIGPQGSGKSVTTKLFYFCVDILSRQHTCAEKGMTLEEFKAETAKLFKIWFPPSAWGRRRFNINFQEGDFTVRFLRRMSKGAPSQEIAVTFSDFFCKQYTVLAQAYDRLKSAQELDEDGLLRGSEGLWRVREQAQARLAKQLGANYLDGQTFIPAGRAFFTSIGRLVAAIEQGSSLDPVTIRFAKLFATLRDYSSRRIRFSRVNKEDKVRREAIMAELFGGKIKFESDFEFVETSDGRIIPFTALSSGQQELLPMWLLLDYYSDSPSRADRYGDLFYIEEPEAHLFPVAQSLLMDFLIGEVVSKKEKRSLVLTTHSPYILSKINNYLKAGQIGRNRKNSAAVSKIVPKEFWLTPSRVKAYAIKNGYLREIIDQDGLIDGSYIDSVSEDVSRDFSRLLDIEFPEGGDV
ncbi:ATP-binding protein [Sphingosinicella sp.]|uniref:AAA family ATPase n=1 Tax=Sphingosinicella sp. TaxID=1917971 RepID=UPI0018147651|nr:ATP-binding protein [Sphingosinicella sp.]MBA4757851.1 ATP-binding protein [Sphingosinicella sp.]